MRLWAFIAIASVAATAGTAATWRSVTKSNDGALFQIDQDSITRDGDFASVWIRVDMSKVPTERARLVKQRMKYNCPAQTAFVASTVRYAANGSVLSSFSDVETSFGYEPVVPDTAGETIMHTVCG